MPVLLSKPGGSQCSVEAPGCSDADAGWKMMIICQRFEAWACNFDWAARCWCGLAGPGGTTSAGGWYFEKISWLAWLWLGRWWLHTTHHTYSYWSFRVGICLTIVTIM